MKCTLTKEVINELIIYHLYLDDKYRFDKEQVIGGGSIQFRKQYMSIYSERRIIDYMPYTWDCDSLVVHVRNVDPVIIKQEYNNVVFKVDRELNYPAIFIGSARFVSLCD